MEGQQDGNRVSLGSPVLVQYEEGETMDVTMPADDGGCETRTLIVVDGEVDGFCLSEREDLERAIHEWENEGGFCLPL